MSLGGQELEKHLILYREVQSEDSLDYDTLDEEREVSNIQTLLSAVRGNVDDHHELDSLDVSSYFRDWIREILGMSNSVSSIDPPDETVFDYVAEDFSESMKSRARERGKYVVLIISEGSLIVCHSFTGKKALTTDMDVIEELLSENNIDKFAEFRYESDEIVVHHFDRHDTQSFTDWLGIPEDEIAFDVKGDVRVYSQIDGIDVVFEFNQRDITSKLLGSDEYDLVDGKLITPNEPPRRVNKVKWGRWYQDTNEFKEDLVKVNHNLQRARDLYESEISDSLDSFFDVVDRENMIIKYSGESPTEIRKPNVDFELSYVNSAVDMHSSWRAELAQKIFSEHEPIPVFHAGTKFSENPNSIGNLRIYNELELSDEQITYLLDLQKTTGDMGTANLQPLLAHIVFEILFVISPKPIKFLFKEFSEEFESRAVGDLEGGTRVLQKEGGAIGLEFKSPPWFTRESDAETIAEGLHKEFQSARLVLLGISEDGSDVDTIDETIKSEFLEDIEFELDEEYGLKNAHVWSLPIDSGQGIVAVTIEEKSSPFETDISILEMGGQ
jgi:hypothetical protein